MDFHWRQNNFRIFSVFIFKFLPPEHNIIELLENFLDEVKSVGKQIQRFLPLWLRNGEDDRISVTVYPTLYSVDFCYQVYELDLSNLNATGFHELNGPVKNYKAFSKQYCVRLYIKVPDYHGNIGFGYSKYNEYDVFIFYEGNYQRFFVCKDGSSTGIYASSLSDYYQYKQETDDTKKLTTVHELKIEDFNDNFFKKYRFSYVDRVQDTGLYLSSAFDLFMKGE